MRSDVVLVELEEAKVRQRSPQNADIGQSMPRLPAVVPDSQMSGPEGYND